MRWAAPEIDFQRYTQTRKIKLKLRVFFLFRRILKLETSLKKDYKP